MVRKFNKKARNIIRAFCLTDTEFFKFKIARLLDLLCKTSIYWFILEWTPVRLVR